MSSAIPGPTASTPLLHAHSNQPDAGPSRLRPDPRSPTLSYTGSYADPLSLPRPFLSPLSKRRRRASPRFQLLPAILSLLVFTAFVFIAWDVSSIGGCYVPWLCRILGKGKWRDEEVCWRNTGAYAPFRPKGTGGGQINLPRGCVIDQVNVLHRHTARFPTTSAGRCMQKALDKLDKRKIRVPRRHMELDFLVKADLNMSGWQFDELMDQGRKSAWRSGKEFAARYRRMISQGQGVFSRSSGGGRVVETGQYWLQGFKGEPFKIGPRERLPGLDLIIPEEEGYNNTLSVHSCPAYEKLDPPAGTEERRAIYPHLASTVTRLNELLRPQPELTTEDLICLSDMCAFDSQREGTEWKAWSPWCRMFDAYEWEILGYLRDVQRYYEVGQGSRYGKTMGAGWINELIARLTDSPVSDTTSTNHTLDDSQETFPCGGKRLFVDFSHDNEMIEIMTGLNIIPQHRDLPLDEIPRKRTYQLSNLIPFGARLVVERIACDLAEWEPDPNSGDQPDNKGREGDGRKDYVRILVNDKIYPVDYIDCKQSGFVEHDMCEVESFLASQSWATEEVDWGICYEYETVVQ